MIAPLACANLCAAIYQTDQGWGHYWARDQVVVAHKRLETGDVIILRGSQALIDWERDLAALPAHHELLGTLHAGFMAGMDDVYAEIQSVITGPLAITGHSLGAARAMILAGLFAANKRSAVQATVFGCPRPGGEQLRDILVMSGTKLASYRNERDVVTYVPFLPEIFCHVIDPTQLHGGSVPGDVTIFREHSISQYLIGLEKLSAPA